MKRLFVLVITLATVLVMTNFASADPLRDPVISGKLTEAQILVDECYRMRKISRPAASELHSRINHYREHALNTEIRHGGFIPPHEAVKLNNKLDELIREITTLKNSPPPLPPAPVPPGPPPPVPPLR